MRRYATGAALAVLLLAVPIGAQPMPGGHPPVGAGASPDVGGTPLEDRISPDPALPNGTIVAELRDERGMPLAGSGVRLGIVRQTVAEGEEQSARDARTGPDGNARFDGLEGGSPYSYRVTTTRGPATYASQPFNLMVDSGYRVRVHVYPATRDVKTAKVGMRGFFYVVPRDDVFQIEMLFRVFNIGSITWVPDDVVLSLPRGSKGFVAQESMFDTRFVGVDDQKVRLEGTFGPGQHDVTFRFQVPNDHVERAELALELPPHVAEMRVIAEAARGMTLAAAGFPDAQPATNQNGQRVLVTGKQLRPGEPELRELAVTLGGLPTRGPGRWLAAGLAGALALGGLASARTGPQRRRRQRTEAKRARAVLLDELVELERARRSGEIGPKTYDRARRELVDALARLAANTPAKA